MKKFVEKFFKRKSSENKNENLIDTSLIEEAVAVFKDLGAKCAFAIHWGTFKLTIEKMDEPPRRLEQAMENADVSKSQFRVLQHGEVWPEVFIDIQIAKKHR